MKQIKLDNSRLVYPDTAMVAILTPLKLDNQKITIKLGTGVII